MRCPKCPEGGTKVIESREVADGEAIRRRRECLSCEHRFTTYERMERPQLIIIKSDGTREMFSREKLLGGLLRATEKTTVSSMQLEELVTTVEKRLYDMGEGEVPSREIGEILMEELAATNDVAYVRFASVYRRFTDIESFERELRRLKTRPKE